MFLRISIPSILFWVAACSPRQVVCPVPELTKLQKSNVKLSRFARTADRENALQEKGMAYDYFQKPEVAPKALKNIEIWDCPKPGLKHDKMVARKSAQLQKRYDKYLKKVARFSEQQTLTVISENR